MIKKCIYGRKYEILVIFLYKMIIFGRTLTQQTFSLEKFNHFILFAIDYLSKKLKN